MKKYLFLLVAFLVSLSSNAQGNPHFNDDSDLEWKEVVEVEGMSKEQIYLAVHQMLADWHYNSNSKNNVDYTNKDDGTVIAKGKAYLGLKKVNFAYGWDTYADYSLTIRCKDGKYQILLKVPALFFKWQADGTEATAPIKEVYPSWKHKTNLNYKKCAVEFAPKVPDTMQDIITAIKAKVVNNPVNDDF